jgi:hypothetical protein
MGILTKIGKGLKKNISFKNLYKLGTSLAGAIPVLGSTVQSGLVSAQENYYQNKELKKQGLPLLPVPSVKDIAGGAALGVVGVYAKESNIVGNAGVQIVNSTIKQFFIKYQSWLVGFIALIAIYFVYNKAKKPQVKRAYR